MFTTLNFSSGFFCFSSAVIDEKQNTLQTIDSVYLRAKACSLISDNPLKENQKHFIFYFLILVVIIIGLNAVSVFEFAHVWNCFISLNNNNNNVDATQSIHNLRILCYVK